MSETLDKAWLNALQPDQEWTAILPYQRSSGGRIVTVKVVRKTTTQIVVLVGAEEQRYRVKDGAKVGDTWTYIPTPATEEELTETRKANRRLNMLARLRDFNFNTLNDEALEAIYKHLPPKTKEGA